MEFKNRFNCAGSINQKNFTDSVNKEFALLKMNGCSYIQDENSQTIYHRFYRDGAMYNIPSEYVPKLKKYVKFKTAGECAVELGVNLSIRSCQTFGVPGHEDRALYLTPIERCTIDGKKYPIAKKVTDFREALKILGFKGNLENIPPFKPKYTYEQKPLVVDNKTNQNAQPVETKGVAQNGSKPLVVDNKTNNNPSNSVTPKPAQPVETKGVVQTKPLENKGSESLVVDYKRLDGLKNLELLKYLENLKYLEYLKYLSVLKKVDIDKINDLVLKILGCDFSKISDLIDALNPLSDLELIKDAIEGLNVVSNTISNVEQQIDTSDDVEYRKLLDTATANAEAYNNLITILDNQVKSRVAIKPSVSHSGVFKDIQQTIAECVGKEQTKKGNRERAVWRLKEATENEELLNAVKTYIAVKEASVVFNGTSWDWYYKEWNKLKGITSAKEFDEWKKSGHK